jgi:hypothetical protein
MEVTMNAPDTSGLSLRRQPRIRVFHAYKLNATLENLPPHARRRMKRRIAVAAIQAMIDLKRGLDVACHVFSGVGCDLVLSARWSEQRATLTIEVDEWPKGAPAITIVGALPRPWGRNRE